MRHTLGAAALLLVTAACATRSQWIPLSPPAPPLRGASASASATRLRIAFPRVPLDSLGCRGLVTQRPGEAPTRRYYFLATNDFPSSRYPDNHFMITGVDAYLPPSATSTPARLDSLLGVSEVTVDEAASEPPTYVQRTNPTFAAARYDGVRVVMEIVGEAAVRAFLAPGADSISLAWCDRGESLSSVMVPLRRTPD